LRGGGGGGEGHSSDPRRGRGRRGGARLRRTSVNRPRGGEEEKGRGEGKENRLEEGEGAPIRAALVTSVDVFFPPRPPSD